jgi:hypothetical protein
VEPPPIAPEDAPTGLIYSLKPVSAPPEAGAAGGPPLAVGGPLDDATTDKLLSRLPPLPAPKTDTRSLPPSTLPPPRPGETVQIALPPAGGGPSTPDVQVGPLEVTRRSPEGNANPQATVLVGFNQPMVPLGAVDKVDSQVPATLEPKAAGKWRWLDTSTLVFQPDVRLPMATDFAVSVPAGTKSTLGGSLAAPVTFRFSTPPVTVVTQYPSQEVVSRTPILWVGFDQRVDANAALAALVVRAGGSAVALRMATAEEVAKDPQVSRLSKAAGEGTGFAFTVQSPLPYDSSVTVQVPPGFRSAEGPRTTAAEQNFSFSTFGPLRVKDAVCGYSGSCQPGWPFRIELTNPVDNKAFDPSWVTVEPAIAGMKVEAHYDSISISGRTRAQTKYTLKVSAAVQDTFGQTLGQAWQGTIQVGPAEPRLWGGGGQFVVLDPFGKPGVSVWSVGLSTLRVKVHKVDAKDWPKWNDYLKNRDEDKPTDPPGTKVQSGDVKVEGDPNEPTETLVDLKRALGSARYGHFVVEIAPPKSLLGGLIGRRRWAGEVLAWVQVTELGLTAVTDNGQVAAWVTELRDGAPVVDASVSLEAGVKAQTDSNGVARLQLPADGASSAQELLVATRGEDSAILPKNSGYWYQSKWVSSPRSPSVRFYTVSDRGLYKPGETARIKGWLRVHRPGPEGDIEPWSGSREVQWKLTDAQGNDIGRGKAPISALGGFDLEAKIPEGANLGEATFALEVWAEAGGPGGEHYENIRIDAFRRPEFEVSARAEGAPAVIGGKATVTVSAAYYAGGPLPQAETGWTFTTSRGSFSPPNHDEFVFGEAPRWSWYESRGGGGDGGDPKSHSGRTLADGSETLELSFESVSPARAMVVQAEAVVFDVNRQAWSASTQVLVHPALVYVGVTGMPPFLEAGKPLKPRVVAVDLDGKRVAGSEIEVVVVRQEWAWSAGEWAKKEFPVGTCKVMSGEEPVECSVDTTEGGEHRVMARVRDAQGRLNETTTWVWVSGGKSAPRRGVDAQQVRLVADKQSYAAGDVAKVLVIAPFSPARGLLTIARDGIAQTRAFSVDGATTTLEVPIGDGVVPGIVVKVELVGAVPRIDERGNPAADKPKSPAYASGELPLSVPPVQRTLSVEAKPLEAEAAPGTETSVAVTVKDAAGAVVPGAEVAVVVIDEAVLALVGHVWGDPVAAFYSAPGAGVGTYHSRSYIQLASIEQLAEGTFVREEAPGGGGGRYRAMTRAGAMMDGAAKEAAVPMMAAPAPAAPAKKSKSAADEQEESDNSGGMANTAIAMRTNFDALAVFSAATITDAEGRTQVRFKLPDNLTRYRVWAIAVDSSGKKFGKGESNVTARLPLMVRPSAPRFLRYGDSFEFPVVLQNQTDAPMSVAVASRAANAQLTGQRGVRVEVPARDRVEVRFGVSVGEVGQAVFQFAAAVDPHTDAATAEIPVWAPATTEAFATYGDMDKGATALDVEPPRDAYADFGGLEISLSTTQLQTLTDAVLYLVRYPYECAEQVSSRLMAVAALRDAMEAFRADGLPSKAEIEKTVALDLEKLARLQQRNGGFGFWRLDSEQWPYLGVHVAHTLVRAKSKGYPVPDDMLARSLGYAKNIASHIPSWYGDASKLSIESYALYVRALSGDHDASKAKALAARLSRDKPALDVVALLLATVAGQPWGAELQAEFLQILQNRATETAAAAHFSTSYSDNNHLILYSDQRTDAMVLEALLRAAPDHPLVVKTMRGLLDHRKAGRWGNTQENVWVLLALDRYFHVKEGVEPNLVARAWLGEKLVAQETFAGRTTDQREGLVPMSELLGSDAPTQRVVVGHEGKGRLYWRLGLRYAPKDANMPPTSRGFTVRRTYEAVDKPDDVVREADGTWKVRPGATVKVKLEMVVPAQRAHVALVDRLPGGLEPKNFALAGTGSVPPSAKAEEESNTPPWRGWWRLWQWYDHQNLRDDRAEAFSSWVSAGSYTFTYFARATTPGRFVAPAPTAEEMYHPETFGRGASEVVVVQ